jgi:hypothetical protein
MSDKVGYTIFKESDGREIAVICRWRDGDPVAHGKELAEFLIKRGFAAYGMEWLKDQVWEYLKSHHRGVYLYPGGTRYPFDGYFYTVTAKEGDEEPTIQVYIPYGIGKVIFEGNPPAMLAWIQNLENKRIKLPNKTALRSNPGKAYRGTYGVLASREDACGGTFSNSVMRDVVPAFEKIAPTLTIGIDDDVEESIKDAIGRLSQTTKRVIFWAAKWDEELWEKYQHHFSSVEEIVLKKVHELPVKLK